MLLRGSYPRALRLPPGAQRLLLLARAAWLPLVALLFLALGVALVLGRLPLPWDDSLGFNSLARGLVVAFAVGALLRAPGATWRGTPLAGPLLAYLAACAASVALNGGNWGELRTFATACGLYVAARAIARGLGPGWLLHWLGLVTIGIVARELLHDPSLLLLDEAKRLTLVTDNPNTLGYAFAVLVPVFVGAAARRGGMALAYAIAGSFGAVLTFSRAAWVALLLGTALLAARREPSAQRRSVLVATAIAGICAALVLSPGRSFADAQRLRIATTSLALFGEHWPVGVGFGSVNLGRVFAARHLELFGSGLFLYHSHNFYIDILTGTGIVGAPAAAWLLTRLVVPALRQARGRCSIEAAARAVSLLAFLAIGLLDTPFYHGRLAYLLAVLWALFETIDRSDPPRAACYAGEAAPAPALARAASDS